MKNNYPLERVGKLQEIKKWNGVKKKRRCFSCSTKKRQTTESFKFRNYRWLDKWDFIGNKENIYVSNDSNFWFGIPIKITTISIYWTNMCIFWHQILRTMLFLEEPTKTKVYYG